MAFGRPFIANPDLAIRFANGWPLAELPPRSAFYRQFPDDNKVSGYTDFPFYDPTTNEVAEK